MAVASITGLDHYDWREFQRKGIIVYLGDIETPRNKDGTSPLQYTVETGYTTNDALTVIEYMNRQADLIALKSKLTFLAGNLFHGNVYFEMKQVNSNLIFAMYYSGLPIGLTPEVERLFEEELKTNVTGACIVSTNMILKYPTYFVSGLLREYKHDKLTPLENDSGVYLFTKKDIPITETLISDLTLEIMDYIDGCAEMGHFPLSTPDYIVETKELVKQGDKYISEFGALALKDSTITVHVNLSSLYHILQHIPGLSVLSNKSVTMFTVTGDFTSPRLYKEALKIMKAEYPQVNVTYNAYRHKHQIKENVYFLDIRTCYWLGLTAEKIPLLKSNP